VDTEQKLSHRSLTTPGREDLSPYPPVGQLSFERIIGMDEAVLDRAFKERHGLNEVFKPGKPDYSRYYAKKEESDARRLELKRVILARLEGIGLGSKSRIWDWHASIKTDDKNPESTLRVILSNHLTDECKLRIEEVWKRLAREAAVLAPYPELKKLEKQVQTKLISLGQSPLSMVDIFRTEELPSHAGKGLQSTRLNLETALKLYLLKLEGLSHADCAQRLGITGNTVNSFLNDYVTKRAREVYRTAIGLKPRYKR